MPELEGDNLDMLCDPGVCHHYSCPSSQFLMPARTWPPKQGDHIKSGARLAMHTCIAQFGYATIRYAQCHEYKLWEDPEKKHAEAVKQGSPLPLAPRLNWRPGSLRLRHLEGHVVPESLQLTYGGGSSRVSEGSKS